jgi:hypothetical protein
VDAGDFFEAFFAGFDLLDFNFNLDFNLDFAMHAPRRLGAALSGPLPCSQARRPETQGL